MYSKGQYFGFEHLFGFDRICGLKFIQTTLLRPGIYSNHGSAIWHVSKNTQIADLLFDMLPKVLKYRICDLKSWIQAPGSRVPGSRVPGSRVTGSRVLDPGSWIQGPGSRVLDPGPGSSLLDPGSWIQGPGSRLLDPSSWIQGPESRVLSPGSWIQSPGSGLFEKISNHASAIWKKLKPRFCWFPIVGFGTFRIRITVL